MKKTITCLSLVLSIAHVRAQNTVADFENLVLGTDTFYENHSSAPWQTSNATFNYFWDTQYSMWDAGFAYTNKNNTVTPTYHNMYAAITGKGYNNSNMYVTGWAGYGGEKMMIKLAPAEETVIGFYVTNSTYAYKTMQNGSGPARAFGDTLNTHSGMEPGDYPDWFKLTVYAYKNGVKKTDTVEFYLADYRFADNTKDYIVNTWEWVDCSSLGEVDSIFFKLFSSDVGQYGINNPTYFCLDNFTTSSGTLTGIGHVAADPVVKAFPNPFSSVLNLMAPAGASVLITDLGGRTVYEEVTTGETSRLDLSALQAGLYMLEVRTGDRKITRKLIRD
jgi:hypothetical protein